MAITLQWVMALGVLGLATCFGTGVEPTDLLAPAVSAMQRERVEPQRGLLMLMVCRILSAVASDACG